MTKIKKLSTGKVQIYQGGQLAVSLQGTVTMRILDENEIQLKDSTGEVYSIFANKVASTELSPAAPAAFSGDAQDLAQLLDASFFFELSDIEPDPFLQGIGAFEDGWGNGQAPTGNNSASSVIVANRLYAFPTFISGEVESFRVVRSGGVAVGNFNFAIYKAENLGNGIVPTTKLYQSPEFTLSGSGQIFIDTPTVPIVFPSGSYFFAITMDAAFVFQASSLVYNQMGFPNTTGIVPYRNYVKISAYQNPLPATWDVAGSTKDTSLTNSPILYYKKTN